MLSCEVEVRDEAFRVTNLMMIVADDLVHDALHLPLMVRSYESSTIDVGLYGGCRRLSLAGRSSAEARRLGPVTS